MTERIQDLEIPENNTEMRLEQMALVRLQNSILEAINETRCPDQASKDPVDAMRSFEFERKHGHEFQQEIKKMIYGYCPGISVEHASQFYDSQTVMYGFDLENKQWDEIYPMIKEYREREAILRDKIKLAESALDEQSASSLGQIDNHYLMQMLRAEYPVAYSAMKKGMSAKIIELRDNRFDFNCARGCVGLMFQEAGCNDYKTINRHILIQGTEPAPSTLGNNRKNVAPKEWDTLKSIFFPTNSK